MRISSKHLEPISVENEALEDNETFCYMGCTVNKKGWSDEGAITRIRDA